jgi:hypothetical protein
VCGSWAITMGEGRGAVTHVYRRPLLIYITICIFLLCTSFDSDSHTALADLIVYAPCRHGSGAVQWLQMVPTACQERFSEFSVVF